MPPRRVSRRKFLRRSATALAALPLVSISRRVIGANERLDIACIGTANRARANVSGVAHENIVALCDVDDAFLGRAGEQYPRARRFNDYRKMLDDMAGEIDAVVISTPDHTHAPAAIRALAIKKHVYCEKPLTHNVAEARQVAEATARAGVVTQLGTQIHAQNNYRRVVELIQSGAIGDVRRVHVWVGGGWHGGDQKAVKEPLPETLHWDLWLGTAPYREYHTGLHPFHWRGWWDFGGGTLADMACHHMDIPFWSLGLRHPTRIEARGPKAHAEYSPRWLIVDYHFPARRPGKAGHGGFLGATSRNPGGPPVHLTWYHGGKRPPEIEAGKAPNWGAGTLFVGDRGMLITNYSRHQLLPEAEFRHFETPEPFIPDSIGHHREWTEACKSGGPTTCNFDYSGALTEAVLLGNVSHRSGEKLEWDARRFRIANTRAADGYLREIYRNWWNA